MSLISWLRQLVHAGGADTWMRRNGHPLRWPVERLALPVAYDPRLPLPWVEALFTGVRRFNEEVGGARPMFPFTMPVPAGDPAFVTMFARDPLKGLWPQGGIYVRYMPGDPRAHTEHQVALRSGEIMAARVSLPVLQGEPWTWDLEVLHELGHVLGIEHSADDRSVMFKVIHSQHQDLLEPELAALRAVYR